MRDAHAVYISRAPDVSRTFIAVESEFLLYAGSHSAPDPTDLPQCARPTEFSETNSFQNWLIVLLRIIYPADRDRGRYKNNFPPTLVVNFLAIPRITRIMWQICHLRNYNNRDEEMTAIMKVAFLIFLAKQHAWFLLIDCARYISFVPLAIHRNNHARVSFVSFHCAWSTFSVLSDDFRIRRGEQERPLLVGL